MPSRRARTNTFSAGITWKEVRRSLTGFLSWFLRVTWFLDYINPLRIYTRWRRRGCVHDSEGNVVIFRQTLLQRIRDSFVTEYSRRRRLLDWVQSLVPAMDINDFSASWTNGVALCALLDALVPGACPELARLKPYHKLNNIRLALKLANKFFALPLSAFRAEEIAIYGSHHQRRVYELLTVIRMLHVRSCAAAGGGGTMGRAPKDSGNTGGEGGAAPASDQDQTSSSMVYCRNIARLCRVRKSGYQTGTVGKVYTFDVWFPDGLNPDVIRVEVLQLEEQAVDGFLLDDERCETTGDVTDGLLSGIPGDLQDLKMDEGPSKMEESCGQNPRSVDDEGPSKMDESCGQMQPSSVDEVSSIISEKPVPTPTSSGGNDQKEERRNVEKNDGEEVKPKPLPVDRSMENGLLRVSFSPAFVGRYQVSAMFGKVDVEGSPLVVSVSPDFGAQSSMDESSRKRLTFAEAAEIIIAKARNSRIYRQMLQNEPTPSSKNSLYDVAAAVLRRTSKVKRTLAFRGGHSQSIINSEKAVVKRRKILKQMITRGGQEIVIERASTSIDESTNRTNVSSLGVPGSSSELSGNSVNACPSFRVDDAATDGGGGERSSADGKARCFLPVPRPDDAVFRCSPMSSVVEKPQRGDLFETEPDRTRITSSDHLLTRQDFENQKKSIQHDEDASKDGEPVSIRSTSQSATEVPDDTEIATGKTTTSALGSRMEVNENWKSDGRAEHSAEDGSASETDARRRRSQFRASSVRETSLAKQHRESAALDESDNLFLLGSNLLDCNIENITQGTPGSFSFDGGHTADDFNTDSLLPFLLQTNHLERDMKSKEEEQNKEHWSLQSTLFDHTSTDKLIPEMFLRDNVTRQEVDPSTGPDVHCSAIVSPQQHEDNSSSATEVEKESQSREPAEVDSQPQLTTSKEPWSLAAPSLPVVLMVDRWTQVKYDEIKEETGWKRPTRRVSPRKRIAMTQETKPFQQDDCERTPNSFEDPGSNSGCNDFCSQRSSRKSEYFHDRTNTEGDMKTPCAEDSTAELSTAKTDDTRPSDPPVKSFKGATRRRRRRRDIMDQSEEGLRNPPQSSTEQPQNPCISSSHSSRKMPVKASCNSYLSTSSDVQLHPVKQRKISLDSDQQLEGRTVGGKESSDEDEKDRMDVPHNEGIDRGSVDSEGLSELRKLDDFFVFLDQFSNGDNNDGSQKKSREIITTRRLSAESFTNERSSTLGSQYRWNTRDDGAAAAAAATSDNDDFLFGLFGNVADEDMDAENQNQSQGGEMWVDGVGGGGWNGDEVDVEEVARFSIYRMCTAFGPGLNEGTVGRLNYFQVRILTKREGHMTVEMSGHRRHSVLEQNVTYIGDNVYDVTYEVSNPGVYAIAVKWANCHVRGSPFVCTVSM